MNTTPKTYTETSRHTVSILPPGHPRRRHFQLQVINRAPGHGDGPTWYVEHHGLWARRDGTWEPAVGQPTCELLEEAALELARQLAPGLIGDGVHTARDVLNMKPGGEGGG